MATQIEILMNKTKVDEGSNLVATAYFRIRASATEDTPTTARYRIDCLKTGTVVQAWASLTPASSIAIPITSTHTAIQSECNDYERKRLTVESDTGDADQCRGSVDFEVRNLGRDIT